MEQILNPNVNPQWKYHSSQKMMIIVKILHTNKKYYCD